MRVIVARPRGFCAGVDRAIEIVERALEMYGPPIYVRHAIVHNKRVVESLIEKGVKFVEELEEVPLGGRATRVFAGDQVHFLLKLDNRDHPTRFAVAVGPWPRRAG